LFCSQSGLSFRLQGFFFLPLANENGDGFVLRILVIFLGILDVDFPTRQSCSEAHVLTFATNGQAELVGRYEYMGMVTIRIDKSHPIDAGRTEGMGDVFAGVRRPTNDINFLAT